MADQQNSSEITPEDAEAYYKRGNMKSDSEDYHGAIDDYTQALRLTPDFAEVYVDRGTAKAEIEAKL